MKNRVVNTDYTIIEVCLGRLFDVLGLNASATARVISRFGLDNWGLRQGHIEVWFAVG